MTSTSKHSFGDRLISGSFGGAFRLLAIQVCGVTRGKNVQKNIGGVAKMAYDGYVEPASFHLRLGGHLEAILGPSWGLLGPSWGPSWGHLGPSWAICGPSWAILRPSWGHLGSSEGHVGTSPP